MRDLEIMEWTGYDIDTGLFCFDMFYLKLILVM